MIFAELAAQRAAPLEEVIKRCLRWWRVTQETITDLAAELRLSRAARDRAHSMLKRSLSVTLVRLGEMFEAERVRHDEERAAHHEELAYLATHDELTKLPNRALIIDRLEQSLLRAHHDGAPVAVLFTISTTSRASTTRSGTRRETSSYARSQRASITPFATSKRSAVSAETSSCS